MEIRIKHYSKYVEVFFEDGNTEVSSGMLNKDEAKEYRDAFRRADEELSEFIGDEG